MTKHELELENARLRGTVAALEQIVDAHTKRTPLAEPVQKVEVRLTNHGEPSRIARMVRAELVKR